MAGLTKAETAVAATTKGRSADRACDRSADDWWPPLPARSSPGPAPNESSEALPSLRCHPTLPSLGNDVEHAVHPHLVRRRAALSFGGGVGNSAVSAKEGRGNAFTCT